MKVGYEIYLYHFFFFLTFQKDKLKERKEIKFKRYFENKRKHMASFTLFGYSVTLTGNILSLDELICATEEQTRKIINLSACFDLAEVRTSIYPTQLIEFFFSYDVEASGLHLVFIEKITVKKNKT